MDLVIMSKKRKSLSIKTRLFVIKRDHNTCQYCGKVGVPIFRYGKPAVVENPKKVDILPYKNYNGKDVIPFEIDHIISVYLGGDNSVENLALSCRRCNKIKEAKRRRGTRKNVKKENIKQPEICRP